MMKMKAMHVVDKSHNRDTTMQLFVKYKCLTFQDIINLFENIVNCTSN